jgi:hypothetical protein
VLPEKKRYFRRLLNSKSLSIIGKIFESSFLINLFRDINIAYIFYKSSQTCDTHTNDDRYKGTERVAFICDIDGTAGRVLDLDETSGSGSWL